MDSDCTVVDLEVIHNHVIARHHVGECWVANVHESIKKASELAKKVTGYGNTSDEAILDFRKKLQEEQMKAWARYDIGCQGHSDLE